MKALIPILFLALLFSACDYIVLPEDLQEEPDESLGWSATATNITSTGSGDLHIDLVIQNDTGDWSAMNVLEAKPAVLKHDGTTTNCSTVFVGTGGHRVAPGFQMKGYIAGTKSEPNLQLLYVECQGGSAESGSTLTIEYVFYTGKFNYYEPEANRVATSLEVNLDKVDPNLAFPVSEPIEGLVQPSGTEITALNEVVLTLTDIERSATGFQFNWQTYNPGEYPTYVHIGNPPVLGADGIIYGRYEIPDLASVPITPAGDKAVWSTEVSVPSDVTNLYILLSVEAGKQRLYSNYAIDITEY